ncbi:MAG: hypothetical protein FRX49_07678 [Trebouxia sp. A1-2]|nr:MAG: hypothetical protein FRX49_07678 [Trebouxia sp. A1-2]
MALFSRLSTPTFRSRQITLWVVGALLFLQLLAVLSTWHCSGLTHRANHGRRPFSALLLQLSGHGLCEGDPESSSFPFEGVLGRSHTVRRQRPYAYAFCLTSVHHLCTALDADIVALVPQSWAPIIEASMRGSNMQDMKTWAVKQAKLPIQPNSPDLVKKLSAQQKMHIFQGVAMADYNLVGILARMLALGVILRPSDIYEHKPGDYNKTHYQKEATSKIMLFEMTEYKQVLYLDADSLILQNLDAVFNLNMTPVALLPVGATESLQYHTHVMLLQPSKSIHAQLQFVAEKDRDHDDVRILSDFFSGKIHSLPVGQLRALFITAAGVSDVTDIGQHQWLLAGKTFCAALRSRQPPIGDVLKGIAFSVNIGRGGPDGLNQGLLQP